MSMKATLESNVQSAGDSPIVGEHALSRQQAPVFDTLDSRPDIPRPQSNLGSLSHGTISRHCPRDLAAVRARE